MAANGPRLIFIVGVNGSGTTMTTRILGAAPGAVALGGNHISIPADDAHGQDIARRFNDASARLWHRFAPAAESAAAGRELPVLVDELLGTDAYRGVTHVVYKRSFPFFNGDSHRPDLSDLFDLFADVRLVVVYRDPRASAVSALRRELQANLRASAVIVEEQLTYIAAQLQTLDPSTYLITSYEQFCADPVAGSRQLAQFCGLDEAGVLRAAQAEGVVPDQNVRTRRQYAPEDLAFLDRFFDARRMQQWAFLTRALAAPA